MIREFDTSEFLSTLIIARTEAYQYKKKGEIGFKRVFMISHKVMRDNPSIRIRISTASIKSFCMFAQIECGEQKIIIAKMDDAAIAKLNQYRPIDENVIHAFVRANF